MSKIMQRSQDALNKKVGLSTSVIYNLILSDIKIYSFMGGNDKKKQRKKKRYFHS